MLKTNISHLMWLDITVSHNTLKITIVVLTYMVSNKCKCLFHIHTNDFDHVILYIQDS